MFHFFRSTYLIALDKLWFSVSKFRSPTAAVGGRSFCTHPRRLPDPRSPFCPPFFFVAMRRNCFLTRLAAFCGPCRPNGTFTRVEPRSVLTIMESALFVYELVMRRRQRSCRTDGASGRRRETDWTVWLPQLLLDRHSPPALPARRLASVPVCFLADLFSEEWGGHIGENAWLPWIQTRMVFHGPNPVSVCDVWSSVTTKHLHTNNQFSEGQFVSVWCKLPAATAN